MISIIIATYNRSKLLPRAIGSILDQTYSDWELVIVDDGSTDSTETVVHDIKDSRIKYFKLDKNRGATYARNYGLDLISGDYFLVWDSDDVLYPNALEVVYDIFENNQNLAVVSAPARSLKNDKEVWFPEMQEGIQPKEIIICRSLATNHKVRISKRILCGDIRYKSKNIDFLVNVEMAERGPWYTHSKYLADVILESDVNSLTQKRKKTNLPLAIERSRYLSEYLNKYKDLLIKKCPEKYAGFSYGASIGFFANNNKKEAVLFIKEAIHTNRKLKYMIFYLLFLIPFSRFLFIYAVKIKNLYV